MVAKKIHIQSKNINGPDIHVWSLIVNGKLWMMLISACLFHAVALSFIGCKLSDCYWGIQNSTNLCLSGLPCCSLILVSKLSDCHLGIQHGPDL